MTTYFDSINPIEFKTYNSKNSMSFKWYDKNKLVLGKTMQQQLRFAVCYWHSFSWNGFDPFGYDGTFERPWQAPALAHNPMAAAKVKADAAFMSSGAASNPAATPSRCCTPGA